MTDDNDDDDLQAFRQAMRDVQPLDAPDKIYQRRPRQQLKPAPSSTPSVKTPGLSFHQYLDPVSADTYLLYHISSLAPRELKKLQKGDFAKLAYLDLHGHTSEQAHDELLEFINACRLQHLHYAIIIHGKSLHNPQQPKIKNCLNHWLRDLPEILAFCSAQPKDGGTGAVYIRLKVK